MDREDYEKQIGGFYSNLKEVWPNHDKWHVYTHTSISEFVKEHVEKLENYKKLSILNCGSGGNTYGLDCDMYHIDIAGNKINKFKYWKVATAEDIPFPDHSFDVVICVGTVINYCDPVRVLQEVSRVLKKGGHLYLEFETSGSVEYIFTKAYFKDKGIVKTKYFGKDHIFWIYSPRYIRKLLKQNSMEIKQSKYMHIISSFAYRIIPVENFAGRFSIFDRFLQNRPIRRHAANLIMEIVKGD